MFMLCNSYVRKNKVDKESERQTCLQLVQIYSGQDQRKQQRVERTRRKSYVKCNHTSGLHI